MIEIFFFRDWLLTVDGYGRGLWSRFSISAVMPHGVLY